MDLSKIEVPVTDEEGKEHREPINLNGKQSDGSMWALPRDLIPEGHEHYFRLKDPGDREVRCDCGLGGAVYPHNSQLIDGHVYKLDGTKVI